MNALVAMALVASALLGAVTLASTARHRGWLGPEPARKSVHVALGSIVALFPAVFDDRWPVWTLAGVAGVVLLAVRRVPALRRRFGSSLHDVERVSHGELYFVLAAALLWQLFPADWIRFSLPFLVLATADANAAVVGRAFGRRRYTTLEGTKTWLGSAAFHLTAGFVTVVFARVVGEASWVEALLLGHLLGTLLMAVEAVAWRGLDNLFLPLFGAVLLDALWGQALPTLLLHAGVATALMGLCLHWRRRCTLDDSAVMGGAVFAWLTFAVGGLAWLLAPLTVFLSYAALPPLRRATRDRPHSVVALMSASGAGLVWLVLHRATPDEALLWPFVAAFAAQLACIGVAQLAFARPAWSLVKVQFVSSALALALVSVPALVLQASATASGQLVAAVMLAAPLGALVFTALQPTVRDAPRNTERWWRQCLVPLAVSMPAWALA